MGRSLFRSIHDPGSGRSNKLCCLATFEKINIICTPPLLFMHIHVCAFAMLLLALHVSIFCSLILLDVTPSSPYAVQAVLLAVAHVQPCCISAAQSLTSIIGRKAGQNQHSLTQDKVKNQTTQVITSWSPARNYITKPAIMEVDQFSGRALPQPVEVKRSAASAPLCNVVPTSICSWNAVLSLVSALRFSLFFLFPLSSFISSAAAPLFRLVNWFPASPCLSACSPMKS